MAPLGLSVLPGCPGPSWPRLPAVWCHGAGAGAGGAPGPRGALGAGGRPGDVGHGDAKGAESRGGFRAFGRL